MGHVRLVHPRHWERNKDRFSDLAFKSAADSGMSVFDIACAEARSGLICAHIDAFYKNVGGDPAVFLIVEDADWPNGWSMKHARSDSGDDCHREVEGPSDKRIKKALMRHPWTDYLICDPNGVRALTQDDIRTFIALQDGAIKPPTV